MKLDENLVEEIVLLRKRGFTIREIAERFGISERRVYQILKDPRLKKPGRPEKTVDREIEKIIINLRATGMCVSKITEHLNERGIHVSYYAVWKVVRRWELNRLARGIFDTGRNYERIFGIFVVTVMLSRPMRMWILGDISNATILEYGINAKLSKIVKVVKEYVNKDSLNKDSLFILQRSPPLVPTRGRNALTKLLDEKNINYVWITRKQMKHLCNFRKRFNYPTHLTREEFIKWMEREGIDALENLCKRISARMRELKEHGSD